jgi:DNA-directed RNA polymerase subunit RPC12/RpoP
MSDDKYLKSKVIYQRVRCMGCNNRIEIERGQREMLCPQCKESWIVYWVTPDMPMVLRRLTPAYWPEGSKRDDM